MYLCTQGTQALGHWSTEGTWALEALYLADSYIGYVTIKDSKYLKIYSVNPLHFIFRNMNGYFEAINKCKYLTLVPTNESKEKIKKYEESWSKIRV